MMHYHSSAAAERLPVFLPLEPHHHRAVEASIVFEFETLLNLSKLSHLSFGAYQSESYYLSAVISLPMTNLKLDFVPLSIVIVRKNGIVLSFKLFREGSQIYIVLFP